jgi:hypothetical protein
MRNRAKCALCHDIIEVLVHNEYVTCKCGEITIGPDLYARATNFSNFLRIDSEGQEKPVTYQDKKHENDGQIDNKEQAHKSYREELIVFLDEIINSFDNLPPHAMRAPVTHADHKLLLMLISSLFKSLD